MTTTEKTAKILAAIAACGRFPVELYLAEGRALAAEGKVKMSDQYVSGGNKRLVWVAA